MFKKVLTTLFILIISAIAPTYVSAADTEYTTITPSDLNTFNEYRYRITDQYIDLKNKFEVNWVIDSVVSARILELAKNWLNYLPDNLINKNYYNSLKSSIERGLKYPENSSQFQTISSSIEDYLNKVNIQKIRGNIESFPSTWNAPLTVTLRWNVEDPTWTKLENYNYTWWINDWWKRKVLWNRSSINYTFNEEWNYSVFLDVTSNHKNSQWFTDVLPFSSRVTVSVKEKVASVIVKVNSDNLWNRDELKFSPEEAKYWLLFDATSSTPTSWTKFTRTSWDFGNWVERTYDWAPKVERVVYANEWEFDVTLELRTNEWKTVKREFDLIVSNPIATIKASSDEGYMWDTFTFTANPTSRNEYLTYSWRIIDIKNDEEILNKSSSTFNYSFTEKWIYNVMLYVTEPSGEVDIDTKIIYINSRAPVAEFSHSITDSHRPNTVFLDWSSSYDPDYSDDWKLEFSWVIDWNRVNLDRPNYNGSNWYYTFDSIWEHSVTLEVTDPEGIVNQKNTKVDIRSILSVDFNIFPRVSQRDKTIRFIADSPEAKFYEWDFGDWIKEGWSNWTISHVFKKSWVYWVKLKVIDSNDNENTLTRNVYIWDTDSPYAYITLKDPKWNEVAFDPRACGWQWAYLVNRVDNFTFSWEESLDITWQNSWLSYSWTLWRSIYSSQSFNKKFDELGCEQLKLVVKSDKNWREDSKTINIKVENIKPTLSWLDVRVKDTETDPVIVNISALWAQDRDGVIQSYLWYYYTDVDPEPQDFRATKTDSTSFVLPKITWNYYFVVVMKDNNEERSISEEITGSKYFITLTWDNVNTPLLDLVVNNSSVWIGDEVTFSANAENILGQNLNNKVKFSWDFDGDWFYDKETTSNVTTYTYNSSWEKRAKVKVSNKWFSNTKTVTVNVSNILKPDFDYYSYGNTYIFFDKSLWVWAEYEWDMWDWNKITTNGSFVYTYEDAKNVHLVKLKLTEWTKIRDITKKVTKNVANIINIRKQDFPVISNNEIEDNIITLKDEIDNVFLYFAFDDKAENYVVDYDIEIDSDLNWWNDDDEDNKNDNSYFSWNPLKIELNEFREQKLRIFTKDSSWKVINSRDIIILKEYIEEDEMIDSSSIVFEWVSDSVKLQLEKIKNKVDSFPKEHKLKWLMYVQRLKEAWNDNREKTNVILEFSTYLDESWLSSSAEIIDILEWLLVDGEADRTEKAIALTALKNMLPTNIACIEEESLEVEWENVTCYQLLVAKLEVISENDNVEENVVLWKQILRNVAEDPNMSVKEKNDFKAILNTFVYWGVNNIPEQEKEEVAKNDEVIGWTTGWSWVIDAILFILKIIFYIILLFTFVIVLFFIYYKLVNKDKNKSFSEFVSEKTWWKSSWNSTVKDDISDLWDILWDDTIKEKKSDNIDPLSWEVSPNNESTKDEFIDPFSYDDKPKENVSNNDIKDPLTWTDKQDKKDDNIETKDNIKNTNSWDVPDWLKWWFDDSFDTKPKENNLKENKISDPVINKPLDSSNNKNDTKISLNNDKEQSKKIDNTKVETYKPNLDKAATNTTSTETKSQIPDWLKGSFDEDEGVESKESEKEIVKEKNPKKQDIKIDKKEESKNLLDKKDLTKVWSSKSKEEINSNSDSDLDKKDSINNKSDSIKKEESLPKMDTKEDLDNLTKIDLDEEEDTSEDNIPDWLKWSIEKSDEKSDKKDNKDLDKSIDDNSTDKKEEKSEKDDKTKSNNKSTTSSKETTKKSVKKEDKTSDSKTKKTQDSTELWDDWMKIPDWLKTEDDNK